MLRRIDISLFILLCFGVHGYCQNNDFPESKMNDILGPYKIGKLLYHDDFNKGLSNWVLEIEKAPNSRIYTRGSMLIMDVLEGATAWFKNPLSGNFMISYKRLVRLGNGKNDRLSDLNQFWMASDPQNSNLFTRQGKFEEYDSLKMYYVGFGGNYNSTTRFRKYEGDGEKKILSEFEDPPHLLEPNLVYSVYIFVLDGRTSFWINGEEVFNYRDPDPLTEGYFGFRTTKSRHEISDFKIYELKK